MLMYTSTISQITATETDETFATLSVMNSGNGDVPRDATADSPPENVLPRCKFLTDEKQLRDLTTT